MYRVLVREIGEDGGSFHEVETLKQAVELREGFEKEQARSGLMFSNCVEEVPGTEKEPPENVIRELIDSEGIDGFLRKLRAVLDDMEKANLDTADEYRIIKRAVSKIIKESAVILEFIRAWEPD